MADWGLRQSKTATGVLFHEIRRIRDSAPLAFGVGVFTLVALIFTIAVLSIAFREPAPPASAWWLLVVFAGFPWFALYMMQRQSVEIILTSRQLSVRKGIFRWRHIQIQDIVLARADVRHLQKPKAFISGIATENAKVYFGDREREFYDALELTVVSQGRGRLRLKSIEPKVILQELDRILAPSVERKGKAWGKHGIVKPD